MKACRSLTKNNGFTLIELTVSLGILVLILAAAVPIWQLGLRLWLQESTVLAVQQDERIVLEMVAREVRRARKDSVQIGVDNRSGQPALQFDADEGLNTLAKISYLQDQAKLTRRKDNGDGAGTNVYLTNLQLRNGFIFAFVNPHTGDKRTGVGCRIADDEVIALVLRCRRNTHDYVMQTQIAPRN